MAQSELLIGCGYSREKKIYASTSPKAWEGLITLDSNSACDPDVLWDLTVRPLPFEDATFDEVHAYDVLEHFGAQGDWRAWFDDAAELHRIMKPGGVLAVIVPRGNEWFSDPGHTRFIHVNHFIFLNQAYYVKAYEEHRPMTDYRHYWKLNFDILDIQEDAGYIAALLRKT